MNLNEWRWQTVRLLRAVADWLAGLAESELPAAEEALRPHVDHLPRNVSQDSQWHAAETYKSLITISTAGFQTLMYLNGGAIVAVVARLVDDADKAQRIHFVCPVAFFVVGLVAAVVCYFISWETQLRLFNKKPDIPWLWAGRIAAVISLIGFCVGAFGTMLVVLAAPAITGQP